MKDLIPAHYNGLITTFSEGAWFNATEAAAHYGKRPIDWLKQKDTKEYLSQLCQFHKVSESHFIKTRKGKNVGGTWFHPKLAVTFARWCDINFAIWCDDIIYKILSGKHPHFDWKKLRSEATSSFKVMNEALRIVRETQGKETVGYHYANEARLVNYALVGKSAGIDRDSLSHGELVVLSKLETKNAVLVAQGFDHKTRKAALQVYATEIRTTITGGTVTDQIATVQVKQ